MIIYRRTVDADRAFIFATMLRSLYYGCELYSNIDKRPFFDNYSKVVDGLLHSSEIRVAVLEDAPDVVLGYLIYQGPVVHFAYVKKRWRREGVMKLLTTGLSFSVTTHLTAEGNEIRLKKEMKYNPFLI